MGNAQVFTTMLQAHFMCESVEAVERGAKVYWLQDAKEWLEDVPDCVVLFPDGCVDFLVIHPGVKPDDVDEDQQKWLRGTHHPLRFIPSPASAESYWREAARHLEEERA